MLTFDQFVQKYNGRYIDFDGKYGCQCVDLMRVYIKEVCGLNPYTIPTADYAKNIYKKTVSSEFFEKIPNTPTGVPQKGDIIFWDWRWPVTGIAGHVAIYSEGNVNRFIAFGENYGKPNFCKFTNYDYRGVLGWIRPRKPKA